MAVGGVAIATALAARMTLPGEFDRLQLLAFDTLQRAAPWAPQSSTVKVVDIDDESLRRFGQWPWTRSLVATLAATLQDLGARSIAFDVVFAEPDRTSPARLAKEWEATYGWKSSSTASLPDHDVELASVFERGRAVTGFGLLAERNGAKPPEGASIATIGGDPAETLSTFHGAIPNLALLEDAAAGHGSIAITASHDEIIRRIPLLAAFDGRIVPSLALEALRVAEDEDTIRIRSERAGGPSGPVTGYTIRIGDYDIPTERDGTFWLHHSAPRGTTTIPAWRILDPTQRPAIADAVKDAIVLVGTSAVGLSDLRATPLDPLEPGVHLHARAIEQILSHHYIWRPSWAAGAEWAVAALLATVIVVGIALLRLRIALPLALAATVAIVLGSWAAFVRQGLLLDPSFVTLTILYGAVAASFARYFVTERDAIRLRSAFTHYLSPPLVEALARDPARLKLGGELREMTFLFTDLEGFTKLTETAGPQAIVSLLNAYLDGLCRIAIEHGGTVDKIVGDAVHVMFNAPVDQADHAERGVRSALAMDAFAQQFSAEQRVRGIALGATRIGVNTGSAIVGNFGGSRRFDYTAHGDAINTAARLESANKALGTRVCIASATAARVSAVPLLPVGTLMLRGKSQAVEVFTPTTDAVSQDSWKATYLDAFGRLLAGDETGFEMLLALHDRHPDHPILALHAARIRAGERSLRMAV
jgi:adenylate cyclase